MVITRDNGQLPIVNRNEVAIGTVFSYAEPSPEWLDGPTAKLIHLGLWEEVNVLFSINVKDGAVHCTPNIPEFNNKVNIIGYADANIDFFGPEKETTRSVSTLNIGDVYITQDGTLHMFIAMATELSSVVSTKLLGLQLSMDNTKPVSHSSDFEVRHIGIVRFTGVMV